MRFDAPGSLSEGIGCLRLRRQRGRALADLHFAGRWRAFVCRVRVSGIRVSKPSTLNPP